MKPWDKISVTTNRCKCGHIFRGKAQMDYGTTSASIHRCVLELPCPACGKYDSVVSVQYDPEMYTLRNEDTGEI